MADDNAVDLLGHGSTIWMQELDEAKPLRHAMHIDVSVAREHVTARLQAALDAGGRILDKSPPKKSCSGCETPEFVRHGIRPGLSIVRVDDRLWRSWWRTGGR